MTVKELIEKLSKFDGALEVFSLDEDELRDILEITYEEGGDESSFLVLE